MTIVEFLTARLDERESGIRAALRTEDYGVSEFDLDDIAAKRAIIERYLDVDKWMRAGHHDEYAAEAIGLETALTLLASPYSERPDYRQEWKP